MYFKICPVNFQTMPESKCSACYSEATTRLEPTKQKTPCHSALVIVFLVLYMIVLQVYLKHSLFTERMWEVHAAVFCCLLALTSSVNFLEVFSISKPLYLLSYMILFYVILNSYVSYSVEKQLDFILQQIHLERFYFTYIVKNIVKEAFILFTRL